MLFFDFADIFLVQKNWVQIDKIEVTQGRAPLLKLGHPSLELVNFDQKPKRCSQLYLGLMNVGLTFWVICITFTTITVLGCPAGTGCNWMSVHPYVSRLDTSGE